MRTALRPTTTLVHPDYVLHSGPSGPRPGGIASPGGCFMTRETGAKCYGCWIACCRRRERHMRPRPASTGTHVRTSPGTETTRLFGRFLFRSRWKTRRVLSLLRRHSLARTRREIIHTKEMQEGRRCRSRAAPTPFCLSCSEAPHHALIGEAGSPSRTHRGAELIYIYIYIYIYRYNII